MKPVLRRVLPVLSWTLGMGAAWAANTNVFEFKDGDRVVLLGDTLVEREQRFGHWEYALTTAFPDRKVTFRNLGWSADLPNGRSRVSFDWSNPEEEWFAQLIGQVRAARPTVVFLGYGMAASFDGEAGLETFKRGMVKLIDGIREGKEGLRFVLLSPIRHEALPRPLPDPAPHNAQLEKYAGVIRELADRYEAHYVNFFDRLHNQEASPQTPFLTDNGIHLTDYGYRRSAEVMAQELGWYPNTWRAAMTAEGKLRDGSYGCKVTGMERLQNRAKMVILADTLVMPPAGVGTNAPALATPEPRVQFLGLPPGVYELRIDGREVMHGPARTFAGWGIPLYEGPMFDQARQLHAAILKKNELFFHRWRPQNSTYLFLFRKHEQGQNAREIPLFDPLVDAEEAKIHRLQKPVPHIVEAVPAQGAQDLAPGAKPASATGPFGGSDLPPQTQPTFETDPDLVVTLWAQNPLLAKPIQMNFDSRGRLWVVSSSVYPQITPGQAATDSVLILEDTDRDGRADSSKVFATGLLIPTGIEPGDGGAYVAQSTELLHLGDTDGDDRADRRRIILSGFGTEDTHHLLHTLRWGFDGRLYMNQSIYIHTHAETPHGVVRLNSGGILALRPETMALEVFMKGLVNSWGHHFDLYGQSFATDGAGTPESGLSGISYVVPGAMYHTYAGAQRILGSISPGSYPKFCGLEMLYSPLFPESWQGQIVTCDFRAHRVVRFALEEKGSAYVASEQPLFLRSTNVTFRPVDVKVGPDGALYIADWSNPIIQHGEVDFRDPRRDHGHGRIWRVAAKGRAGDTLPDWNGLSYLKLFDLLLSPNGNTRKQAQRVLKERGAAAELPLSAWLAAQGSERARLEGLWMYQALNKVAPELLFELLETKDGRVRAAAVRVLAQWVESIPNPLALLARRLEDDHPRVRLEALRALSRIPSAEAASLAFRVLVKPMDTHLDYAVWLTINDLAVPWTESIRNGTWKVEGHEKELEFGLKAIPPSMANGVMDVVLAGRSFSKDGSGPWIDLVGKAGGPNELNRLWNQVKAGGFEATGVERAFAALNQAARLRQVRPASSAEGLGPWLASAEPKVRIEAVRLAGAWNQAGSHLTELLALLKAEGTSPDLRQAVFETLRETGGAAVVEALTPLGQQGVEPLVRRQTVNTLMGLDMKRAVPLAVSALHGETNESASLGFWRELLRFKGAGPVLAAALPVSGLPPVMAKAGLRAAREGGRQEPELILALSRGANLDTEAGELTAVELKQFADRVMAEGKAQRGELVYRRLDMACATCHAIGGVGGKVGPDLTSVGASAPVDYLIESMLYPNRKVKEGYHSVVVETKDGEEFAGILVRESGEELVVRDASNRDVAVAKNNVARRSPGNSLMPSGLLDGLSVGDRLDLIRFMSELGKPGAFDATRSRVARLWWLRPGTLDLAQFGEDKVLQSDVRGAEWLPATALVDGRLLKQDFEAALATKARRDPKSVYAAARFQSAKAGPVKLTWDAPPGSALWVDGKPVAAGSGAEVHVPEGVHTVTVKLDARKLPDYLRVEVGDGVFLAE